MNFDDFLGVDQLRDRLRADVNGGHLVHAYLFAGPKGTGKRSMAEICARALNCAGAQKPCDACPSCQRHLSRSHPDVIRLESDKTISVDDVRDLIARVMLRPYEGGRHVVILPDADRMTVQAQNALLKTLETPPLSAVFFLTTESEARLLPTVRSRCRIVRFHAIGPGDCARALTMRGIDAARAGQLAAQALGSVGRALALDQDASFWALRERVLSALEGLKRESDVGVAAGALKDDKDNAHQALDIMEHIARERMLHGRAPGEIPGDRMLRGVLSARERLSGSVVWQNVLEKLFFELVASQGCP